MINIWNHVFTNIDNKLVFQVLLMLSFGYTLKLLAHVSLKTEQKANQTGD